MDWENIMLGGHVIAKFDPYFCKQAKGVNFLESVRFMLELINSNPVANLMEKKKKGITLVGEDCREGEASSLEKFQFDWGVSCILNCGPIGGSIIIML